MSIIAAVMFSVIATGDHWLAPGGAKWAYAADSNVQNSKPTHQALPRTVKFSGEVSKGRSFEKPIGADLFFHLISQELGWTISVGSKESAGNNFCEVVTPPYRGINSIHIDGWHFRNADNSGPNEVGSKNVNAPQEVREFYFVLNNADHRKAIGALQILLWRYSYSKREIDDAEHIHAQLPKGNGRLTIRDLKLNTLERGKQAGIERLTFDVELQFR